MVYQDPFFLYLNFNKLEDAIIGSVPHALGLIINELSKNAFMLAFEKDLADLKGLVDPESIAADDFELLENVNDPVVQVLLESVDRVITCMTTYYLINNLDDIEVMENEEYNEIASGYVYGYIIDWESKNYADMLYNLNAIYLSLSQVLYHASCQLSLKVIDVPDHIYDDFFTYVLGLNEYELNNGDKNIALLFDLMDNLSMDLKKIDQIFDN